MRRAADAMGAVGGWAPGTLRVLTLKQPWASAIAAGVKDVENRSWSPENALFAAPRHSNGWFAVHAGSGYQNPAAYYSQQQMQRLWPGLAAGRDSFPRSGILAVAHVAEVLSYSEIVARGGDAAAWALRSTAGRRRTSFCWRVDRVVRVPAGTAGMAMGGSLGLWACPAAAEVQLRALMLAPPSQ